MSSFKEIVTKAVVGKGRLTTTEEYSINTSNSPSTILGCWVINHKFSGVKQNDKIVINGSYDINIWYSYDSDTKTDVIKKTHTYSEVVKMHEVNEDYDNTSIVVRSLTDPRCVKVDIDNNTINYQVDLELGIELVGDVKVKVQVLDKLDDYNLIEEEKDDVNEAIEKEVKEDYLKE